jgi:gamma-glutamyl hercynylcysteine S-oxide synthase
MNDRISSAAQDSLQHADERGAGHPRHLTGDALAIALRDARARTWALVDDLTDAQWNPPLQLGVNPIAWELAHLAWFAEFWILRGPHGLGPDGLVAARLPPRIAGPDAHLDSSRLPHAARWTTPMPNHAALKRMLDQLEACLHALPRHGFASIADEDQALYFHRLALFHEDMHGEALCWLRSALGYAQPRGYDVPMRPPGLQIAVPASAVDLGSTTQAGGFAFDNERPGKRIMLNDFVIDSQPVSALAFAQFVDAGGYDQAQYWPGVAGAWRSKSGLRQPAHWRRGTSGQWQMRWFDQWLDLQSGDGATHMPAIHLNAHEAEAYCLWAHRSLPSAAQWEHAARSHTEFAWGHSVWEWTADHFEPYPGFASGPYREYSQPWFGDHRELRGGAFATRTRMHDARYRNFFLPQRSDIFAGFRTIAPSRET